MLFFAIPSDHLYIIPIIIPYLCSYYDLKVQMIHIFISRYKCPDIWMQTYMCKNKWTDYLSGIFWGGNVSEKGK